MSNAWFDGRKACPACASDRFHILYECGFDQPPVKDYLIEFYARQQKFELEYLIGARYVLCECDTCDLVFQRDIPNPKLMAKLYEHWIADERDDPLAYYARHAQEIMQVISYFGTTPSSLRFLDFGMGWGKWALMAKAFGCESYGAESSPKRKAHAKANGIRVIEWDDIPKQEFDFINSEQVFEHLAEPLQALRHLRRALKPAGIVKISVPTATNIGRRLRIMDWQIPKGARHSLNPVAPLEHINCFRRTSLAGMARAAGMEEVFVPMRVQYRHVTDWTGLKRIAKNVFLPLYRNLLRRQNYVFLRQAQERSPDPQR